MNDTRMTTTGLVAVAVVICGCTGGSGGAGGGMGGSGGSATGGGSAGTPTAEVTATTVDFANVGCGKPAVAKSVSIKNTGTATLTFTTTLSGFTGFAVTSPASSAVSPGATATIDLSAAIPATSAANVDQTGTLTINTNDTAHPKFELALKAKSAGVTLALNPTVASFGVVPVNTQAPTLPMTLTNNGNVAATLNFVQPADAQFGVKWLGSPASVTVAPGATVQMLGADFKPSKITASSASATISVTEAVCGNGVLALPMTGQGTNGVVGLPSDVFFGTAGKVNCGTTAGVKTFTLTNSGNAAYAWTGTLAKGAASPFSFMPQSGTVPANNGTITITVTPTAIPAAASTATDAFGDTLQIVTDVANDTPHNVALHMTANGAVLNFAPSAIDFGLVPVNKSANATFNLVNDGSAPATVTLMSSNAKFTLMPTAATMVGAGTAAAIMTSFFPGASVVQETSNVSVTVDAADVLCAPLPGAAVLTGQGTNAQVSYSPVLVDFGNVNCGTTAAPKTVTFRNDGNQDYVITPSLGAGAASAFTVSMSPDSGLVVQDGGTVVITATPKPIPQTSAVTPNLYGDTLTVTTNVPMDTPHDIQLRETARGSIFAISATQIDFGSVAVGANGSNQFTVSNTGNAAGALSFASGQPAIFQMPSNASIPANGSAGITGNFTPMGPMAYTDTANITATTGTVLCAPLPFTTMALKGSGSAGNVVALGTNSLTFGAGGLVPCGSTAPAKTVNVTNNSTQTLTMTYSLAGGASSPYTVSGPATIASMTSGTVTVTPKAIPATSTTTPDGYADTLTVTGAGGVVNEGHTVALHMTAQGAILTFNPTSITSPGTNSFTVNNTGNLAAMYTLTVGGAQAGDWSVNPSASTVNGGASVSTALTYNRAVLPLGAHAGHISIASTVGRCAPLPANLTLTGN